MSYIFVDGQRLAGKAKEIQGVKVAGINDKKAEEVNSGNVAAVNDGKKEEFSAFKSEFYSVIYSEKTLAYTCLPETDKELFDFIGFVTKEGFGKCEHLELANLDFTGHADNFAELISTVFKLPALRSLVIRNCKPMSAFLNIFTETKFSSKLTDVRIQFAEDCKQEEMDCIKAIVGNSTHLQTFLVAFYYENKNAFIKAKGNDLNLIMTALANNKNLTRFELAPSYRQNEINNYIKNNPKITDANAELQAFLEEETSEKEIKEKLMETLVNSGVALLETNPTISFQQFCDWAAMQLHMIAPLFSSLESHQLGVKRNNDAIRILPINSKHKFFKDFSFSYYQGLTARKINFQKFPLQNEMKIQFNKDIADSRVAFNFDANKKLHNVAVSLPKMADTDKILTADSVANRFEFIKEKVKTNTEIKQYLDIMGGLLWAMSQASPYIGHEEVVQLIAKILFKKNGWQFSERNLIYPLALVEPSQRQFGKHFAEEYCALYQQVTDNKRCLKANLKLSEEINKLINALRPYSSLKNAALYQKSGRYIVNHEGVESTLILLETQYKDTSFASSASRLTSFFASKVTAFFNAELHSLINETITVLRDIMAESDTNLQIPARLISDLIGAMESTIYFYGKMSRLNKNADCEQILLLALNNLYNIDFNIVYPDLVSKKQKVEEVKLVPAKLNTKSVDYRSEDEQSLPSIHNSIQDYSDLNKAGFGSDDDFNFYNASADSDDDSSDEESLAGKVGFDV